MTSYVAHVRATANTGATTQDVTAFNFGAVAAVFVAVTNALTDGTEAAEAQMSLGFWVPSATHRAITLNSEDNKGTRTDTKVRRTQDHSIVLINNAGQVIRQATFAATTNGITISWFDSAGSASAPPAAWKMEFLFVGGTDAEAAIVDVAGPPVSGSAETVISSLFFRPDALIFLGPGTFPTSPSTNEGAQALLGFATRAPSILNSCVLWEDPDNVLTTALVSLVSATACMGTGAGSLDGCSVTAFSSTGFTVQNDFQIATGPDTTCLALELPGLNWWTGTISSPTSTGNADHGEPGFKPQAAIIGLALSATAGTAEQDQDAGPFGVGIVGDNHHGAMSSGSAAVRSSDGVNLSLANTDTGSLSSAGPVRILDGFGTLRLAADTPVWIQSGLRLNWATVQGTARRLPVLFVGAVPDEFAPSAVVAPGVVSTPTITRDLRPAAAVAPGVVPAPALALTALPSAVVAPGVVPTPTIARVLTPAAVVAVGVIPAPTVVLAGSDVAPDPVVAPGVVPSPTIAAELLPAAVVAPGVVATPAVAAELVPAPAVAPGVVSTPAISLELAPAAAAAPGVVPAPSVALEVLPSPVVAVGVVPTPSLGGISAPDPVVAAGVVSTPTVELVVLPAAVVAPGVVPDPSVEQFHAPDAVVAAGVVPAPTITLEVVPSPVVAPGVVPAPSLGGISAPDPVVAPGVVPAPSLTLEAVPTPVVAPGVVQAPTIAAELVPAPVVGSGVVPAPTLSLELTPASVDAPAVVPTPTIALQVLPAPVVAPGVVPAPVVAFGETEVAPDPVVGSGVVPAPTITLEVLPAAVVAPGVVPPIALGGISAPDPVVAAGVVSAPTVALELHPDPVVAPGVVPAIALGPVAAPDPVAAAGVVPAPLVVLELAPTPVVAAGVAPAPVVVVGRARFVIGLELNRRAQTSRAELQRRLDLPLEDEPGTIALDLEVPARL